MVFAHPAYMFSPFAIPPAITAVIVLALGTRVLTTRFSRISVAIFGLSVATAGWQLAFAVMYLADDAPTALIWARIGYACVALMAPGVYQFATSILPLATYRRIISRIAWLIGAQFGILTLSTDYLVTGVRRFWWGFYPTYSRRASVPYLLFFGILLAAALVELIRAYPSSKGTERERVRLFAIALGIAVLAVVDYLPVYGMAIYPFGWAALLAYTAVAVYSVRKHGLVPITPSLAANEIISTMRDLLLVTDRDGRIQFANNAAYAFLGYGRDDIVGHQLDEIMVPLSDNDATLRGRFVRDLEYVFRTKTGQPIELTLSHSPVTHQGEVTGAVIIGRDLRERKRYEWEARRAVTLLQSTLDSTSDGILVMGEGGRVLTWNQRFTDIWGIPAELMEQDEDHDFIGQLVEQLVDPAEFLLSLETLHAHPEVESLHLLEFKDGRRFEQYSIGRYLGDSPLRVWSFHDVTARMSAEEALRDSEERYRLLFEQNAAGVCLATTTGRIVDCNSTFAEMVGYGADELKTRSLRDVFDRVSAAEELRHRLDETPTLRSVEIVLRRSDGVRVASLANVSLLGKGEGALVHMTAVDISDRKRAEEQVEFHAYHDALTQLPNRRLFTDRLELSLLAAKRARGHVAVLFIDLDKFKTINDTFGHTIADELLVETSRRLRNCVRQTDTVARFGGDEFTILLPDLHEPDDAARVAEKIVESAVQPVTIGVHNVELSVSVGVAVYPYDGVDYDTLLRNADDAMYRAKEAGRNGYQLCTEQMKIRAIERSSMQLRVKHAMENHEVVLAYQPQVSMSTGLIVGAEVLIRWNDRESGVVEAEEFIPIAEDTGLIVPLTEWALFEACRQHRQWRDEGLPPLRIGVNISGRHFQQRDLAGVIRRAIDEAGIDAASLELEISESTAMHHVDVTIEMLNALRQAGVSIVVDDFGSAFSSLRYLQLLPIDGVKVDRRLVANAANGSSDASIAGAVIDVSRSLGLRVIADGVTTSAQVDFLQLHGCAEVQGRFFSPAVDSDAFKRLLLAGGHLPRPQAAPVA